MKYLLLNFFVVFVSTASAQFIKGIVTNRNGDTLTGATIFWRSANNRITDTRVVRFSGDGSKGYSIGIRDGCNIKNGDTLGCAYIGYKPIKEVIQNNNTINFILDKVVDVDTDTVHISGGTYYHIVHADLILNKRIKDHADSLEARRKRGMEEEDYNRVYMTVITAPEFPGGTKAVERYIQRNAAI